VTAREVALARAALAAGDGLLCQSICLDLLAEHPSHGEAASLLLGALTSAPPGAWALTDRDAAQWVDVVPDPVERQYLHGMLAYRRAVAMQAEAVPGFVVRGWLDKALASFDAVLVEAPEHAGARVRAALVRRIVAYNPELAPR